MIEKLIDLIENQEKAQAVILCLNALEEGKMSVPELYENNPIEVIRNG